MLQLNKKQAHLGVPHLEIQVEIDSQLCIESNTVLSVAKAQNYVGGDTAQNVSQKGGTLHILSEQRDKRGGTPHIKI